MKMMILKIAPKLGFLVGIKNSKIGLNLLSKIPVMENIIMEILQIIPQNDYFHSPHEPPALLKTNKTNIDLFHA